MLFNQAYQDQCTRNPLTAVSTWADLEVSCAGHLGAITSNQGVIIWVYFGWSRPGLSRHSFHPEMKSNSLDIMNATLKRPEMIQYVHWISCMLFGTFQDRDKQWDLFMFFFVSPPKFQLNW